jgi:hypothetical protein
MKLELERRAAEKKSRGHMIFSSVSKNTWAELICQWSGQQKKIFGTKNGYRVPERLISPRGKESRGCRVGGSSWRRKGSN